MQPTDSSVRSVFVFSTSECEDRRGEPRESGIANQAVVVEGTEDRVMKTRIFYLLLTIGAVVATMIAGGASLTSL